MDYKTLLRETTSSLSFDALPVEKHSELMDFLWDITRKACREDFYTYVKVIGPVLIPGFKSGRHIEIICKELQALYEAILTNDKTRSKLQVYLPPESTKTVLCSHLFPTWLLGLHPEWRIIAVAHSAPHAQKELGANARRIVNLQEYQEIFPKTKVSRESPGAGFWKTTKHGYYFSGGHATQFPGKRANLLLADDVISEQTLPSELKTICTNYGSGLESRLLEDNSGQLLINTRWALNDLSGFLEERDGCVSPSGRTWGGKDGKLSERPWRVVKIPALLDEDSFTVFQTYPSDGEFNLDTYQVGESYWPQRKSKENLLDAKRRLTPHQWAALYMQALALDTPVPTPTGWSTIGNLKIGDKVIGANGRPTKIINKSPVFLSKKAYKVSTQDGAYVVADQGHLWQTKVWRNDEAYSVKTTEYLAERFLTRAGRHPRIPISEAWKLSSKKLEVDPYVFGLWLGDGNSSQATFTAHENDMPFYFEEIKKSGYKITRHTKKQSYGVTGGFQAGLRKLNVLGNKHVPKKFLRASFEQRLALLQGLMDTDGSCQNGQATFANTNIELINAVKELVLSLGGKPTITKFKPKKAIYNGRNIDSYKICYRVHFYLDNCFRLPRKLKKCRAAKSKNYRFLYFEVIPNAVEMQCITVEAKDGLFLAGEGCMVTHNSPIPLEGSIFSVDAFRSWRHPEPPEVSTVIISLDTAFSERKTKDSAESVYQIWGIFPLKEVAYDGKESMQGHMILLGYRKGYWSFPELKEICKSLYEEYQQTLDFFLIEDRASGISLIQELNEIGLPVLPYSPDKDKISRAHAASALIHSGRVYLNPNMLFTQEFLAEVLKFPSSGRDTVDALSQAILWMRNAWLITPSDYNRYKNSFNEDDGNVVSFQRRAKTYWTSVNK